jgi:hypothetical protein
MIPPPPPKPDEPGVLEDLIDIFASPAKVFARRAKGGGAAMFFIVAIALGALGYTAKPVLDPVMEAQFQKGMAAAQKANPQMTAEQMQQGMEMQRKLFPVYYVMGPVFALLALGLCVWLVGKIFGAAVTFGSSMMIASMAWIPRIIGAVIVDIQALTASDTSTFRDMAQLSVGPARFFDPATASPVLLASLLRVDLLVIWSTILIAVGYAAAGKLEKGKAIGGAVVVWLIAGLFAVWGAARQ